MKYIFCQPFHAHSHVKESLLKAIEQYPDSRIDQDSGDTISKTDWVQTVNNNSPLPYKKELAIHLSDHCVRVLNHPKILLKEIWFQQYKRNDTHTWHTHEDAHFTNVYFVELPDKNAKTQIKDMDGSLIEYEAKEGDILTFPGFLYHQSPLIETDTRKTIVSFNLTICS